MAIHELTPEETAAAFKGPALLCDRVVVLVGSSVRISFHEHVATGPLQFRTAVSLSHSDALDLANLLKLLLVEGEETPEKQGRTPNG